MLSTLRPGTLRRARALLSGTPVPNAPVPSPVLANLAAAIGCCLVGGVVAVSTLGSSTAVALSHSPALFPDRPLGGGSVLTGRLALASGDTALTPYLQALDVRDSCAVAGACPSTPPRLSSLVDLTVTAPDGGRWTGTVDDLTSTTTLPGGRLPAHSGTRDYVVTASLPAAADTNADEDLRLSFGLEWGGTDSSGTHHSQVLGQAFGRGSSPEARTRAGKATTAEPVDRGVGLGLAFTGGYILVESVAAIALLAAGIILLVAGRRRWRGSGD